MRKNKGKRILAIILSLVMALLLMPDAGGAAGRVLAAAASVVVTDEAGLRQALEAAGTVSSGDRVEITLGNDVLLEQPVPSGYSNCLEISGGADVTLDLNGHKLSNAPAVQPGSNLINVSGSTLTVNDSGGAGRIEEGSGGALNVIAADDSSTVIINGGTIRGATCIWSGSISSVTVNGGTLESTINQAMYIGGSCSITNGTLTANLSCIVNAGGNITIDGGKFTSDIWSADSQIIKNDWGTVTVNGGVFESGGAVDLPTLCSVGNTGANTYLQGGVFRYKEPPPLSSPDGGTTETPSSGPQAAFRTVAETGGVNDFLSCLIGADGTKYAFTDNTVQIQPGTTADPTPRVYSAPEVSIIKGSVVEFDTGRTVLETYDYNIEADRAEGMFADRGSAAAITIGSDGHIYAAGLPVPAVNTGRVPAEWAAEFAFDGWYREQTNGDGVIRMIPFDFAALQAHAASSPTENLMVYGKWNVRIGSGTALSNNPSVTAKLNKVTLTQNIAVDGTIQFSDSGTEAELDLAGHTVTSEGTVEFPSVTVTRDARLIVSDSAGGGKINNSVGGECIKSSSSLAIKGGAYETTGDKAVSFAEFDSLSQNPGLELVSGSFAAGAADGCGLFVSNTYNKPDQYLASGSHFSNPSIRDITGPGGELSGYGTAGRVTVFSGEPAHGLRMGIPDFPGTAEYGGLTASYYLTLENTGNVDITLNNLTVDQSEYFELKGLENLPLTLVPGQSANDKLYLVCRGGIGIGACAVKATAVYASAAAAVGEATSECTVQTTVTPRPLEIAAEINDIAGSGTQVVTNKEYDGGRNARVTGIGSVSGILSGDQVEVKVASAEYDTAEAGENKTITVAYTVSGSDSVNYLAPASQSCSGAISKAGRSAVLSFPDLYAGENPADRSDLTWSGLDVEAVPEYSYKAAADLDTAFQAAIPTEPGSYTVKAVIPETVNYQRYEITDSFVISYLPAPQNPYRLEGDAGKDGWYPSSVTVYPAEGYQICGPDGFFGESVTADATVDIHLKKKDTGARTDKISVALKIDRTAPVFTEAGDGITIAASNWREFLNSITFGLFLKETTRVTIQATDSESGIDRYEYLISPEPVTLEQLKAHTGWSQGSSFYLTKTAAQKSIVYARVTNNAGWTAYLSSDGIIYDDVLPVITVAGTPGLDGAYTADKLVVNVSDDYLASVTVDGTEKAVSGNLHELTIYAKAGENTVITARDKAGNLTESSITLRSPEANLTAEQIEISKSELGYVPAELEKGIFVRNGGLGEITLVDVSLGSAAAEWLELTKPLDEIIVRPGEEKQLGVLKPKSSLAAGVYSGEASIRYRKSDNTSGALTVGVTFTVEKRHGTGSVEIADWFYGETANTPVLSSDTNGTAGAVCYYKEASAADDAYTEQPPFLPGSYVVKAVFAEKDTYGPAEAVKNFQISYLPVPENPVAVEGAAGTDGWYVSAVTIRPKEGYQISGGGEVFAESLSADASGELSLYLRSASGARTDKIPLTLKLDSQAPVIAGAAEQAVIYADSIALTVQDDNLKEITVNSVVQDGSGTARTVTLSASVGPDITVRATDLAGNSAQLTIQLKEAWIKEGLNSSGRRQLKPGVPYKFGGGSWRVAGDSTVYQGGGVFYAALEGEYEFTKG